MTEKKDGGELQKAVPGERLTPFLKQMQEEEQGEMSLDCWELLVNQLTSTETTSDFRMPLGNFSWRNCVLLRGGKKQGYIQGLQGSCHLQGRDGKGERASLWFAQKKKAKSRNWDVSLSQLAESSVPDPMSSWPVPRDMEQLGHPVSAPLAASWIQLPLLLPCYLPARNLW